MSLNASIVSNKKSKLGNLRIGIRGLERENPKSTHFQWVDNATNSRHALSNKNVSFRAFSSY